MSNITLNGIEYTPVAVAATGTRAVVVVDRGWIFAGDVTRENGRIRLARAVHVFSWEISVSPRWSKRKRLICARLQMWICLLERKFSACLCMMTGVCDA